MREGNDFHSDTNQQTLMWLHVVLSPWAHTLSSHSFRSCARRPWQMAMFAEFFEIMFARRLTLATYILISLALCKDSNAIQRAICFEIALRYLIIERCRLICMRHAILCVYHDVTHIPNVSCGGLSSCWGWYSGRAYESRSRWGVRVTLHESKNQDVGFRADPNK